VDTLEKIELAQRTRARNSMVWMPLSYGGILAPLAEEEAVLNKLAAPSIENFLAISSEAWDIKDYQIAKTSEMGQIEVDQDRLLAEAKAITGLTNLALQRTTDEVTLAVKQYDARIKGLLMGAREYAALVERELLATEESRTVLSISKEELRQLKVQADIYLEAIKRAQVEADLARAKVDVAKAHVRAAIAGIEAGKAEIDLIEAETQVFVAEADKATLQADVAMIFAEIVTKQLSETKLAVGQAEISAGFTYIQSKITDAIAMYGARTLIEGVKTAAEESMKGEIAAYQAVRQAEATLRDAEASIALFVTSYEAGATQANISAEAGLRQAVVVAKNALSDAHKLLTTSRDTGQTAAQKIISNAHKSTYNFSTRDTTSLNHEIEYISG
jgi:hypothetical protein